jgi:HAMP domain-containing protein
MRQLIWGLITVLMAYGGWQFLRALRVGFRRRAGPLSEAAGELDLNLDDDLFNYEPSSANSSRPPAANSSHRLLPHSHSRPHAVTNSSGSSPAEKSAREPAFDPMGPPIPGRTEGTPSTVVPQDSAIDLFGLELELQCMRREIGSLQGAVETQRQEIENLRTELERAAFRPKPVAAEAGVSPEYDEALALARRGLVSSEIAARCGITRAEAELVASLAARGREPGRKLS